MKKTLAEKLKEKYTKDSQIECVEIQIGKSQVSIFYIESIVDKKLFTTGVLSPIQKFAQNVSEKEQEAEIYKSIKTDVLSVYSVTDCKKPILLLQNILYFLMSNNQ